MVGPGSSRGYNQYLSIKEEQKGLVRSWPATYSFILYGAVRGVVPYIFIFVLKGNLLDLIGGVIFPRDSLAGGPCWKRAWQLEIYLGPPWTTTTMLLPAWIRTQKNN